MSKASLEGDKPLQRRKSFKEIQNAISRIDRKLLKAVIGNGAASTPRTTFTNSTPPPHPAALMNSHLPAVTPLSISGSEKGKETAPLTIFYNGAVCVYDVPQDMATRILELAEKGNFNGGLTSADPDAISTSSNEEVLVEKPSGDLPIARKQSLQRFLQIRKGHLKN